eukprot:CAMPEP_0175813404 /NCGR_PEP_ID=MMETSP0107_2-20121207/4882_1 /TAXON_ID=195067 ORGANISM="Goniomonas pacifica, Strain CCMP1869" /NCGR_SAMPLE_ID=MMETSP0107_2 /ASSEMBLY_ACC=CAM_ASM_000203 /LENGTH=165 /DNA_ID=CAMNT_0017125311 /DNA_START=35 /DNA_END=533 /DNA_ORIENTATION=-
MRLRDDHFFTSCAEERVSMQKAKRRDFWDLLELGQGGFERGFVGYVQPAEQEEYPWEISLQSPATEAFHDARLVWALGHQTFCEKEGVPSICEGGLDDKVRHLQSSHRVTSHVKLRKDFLHRAVHHARELFHSLDRALRTKEPSFWVALLEDRGIPSVPFVWSDE